MLLEAPMKDDILLVLLALLPMKSVSRLVGKLAKSNFSRNLIPFYARHFKIDVTQAEKSLSEYPNLVEFFIRRLKPGQRPVSSNENSITSPVDGKISAFGTITNGELIQAKGVNYQVKDLLGGDVLKAKKYLGGSFMTIYLSPRDYHRIHAPFGGQVTEYTYVPGTLFPVNALGVRAVKGLFAKNERLITFLQTKIGEVAVVKVGATIVGSVKVFYDSFAGTNIANVTVTHKWLQDGPVLTKGAEIGYFEFGSTVILLFEPDQVVFDSSLKEGESVQMGQEIGRVV